MVAYLFLTQDILVRFRMRPGVGLGEFLVSIAQLVERATVNRKATGSTPVRNVVEQLVEHSLMWFNRVKRGTFLCPRFRFESERQNGAAQGATSIRFIVGGYHARLSLSRHGFESRNRNRK